MLVLSRHKDEVIRINDDIQICVVDIRSDKVRIGIEASETDKIFREEIYQEIKREDGQVAVPAQ